MSTRMIHRSAVAPTKEIAEALEALFLSEFLDPGRRLLIVSPWISDFPLIDNRAGQFSGLVTGWVAGLIPFSTVLRGLLTQGVSVHLGTGPSIRESEFVAKLEDAADLDGTRSLLSVVRQPHEHQLFSHEKALVADRWAVYGSMNLTYSGVQLNGELITVTTEPDTVANLATTLHGLFE
ncbi:phospholipase D-like domain-containing protein DpdK [Mycolicibacterium sp. XJ662]